MVFTNLLLFSDIQVIYRAITSYENIDSNTTEVVVVPHMTDDLDVSRDQDHVYNNIFDRYYMHQDIAGEIETQHKSEDSTEVGVPSDSKPGRK